MAHYDLRCSWKGGLHAVVYVLVLLGSAVATLAQLKKIEAPCSACRSVAVELQRRMNAEVPKNHLDLRHRLDAQGQRYGKVIEYKASELRAVELLDALCARMRDYTLVTLNGTRAKRWMQVKGEGVGDLSAVKRPEHEEEEAKGKRLESYCGSVLEEYEEEVYAGIMKGGFDTHGVEDQLCRGIITACPAKAPAPDGGAAPADGEEGADEAGGNDGSAAAAGGAAEQEL